MTDEPNFSEEQPEPRGPISRAQWVTVAVITVVCVVGIALQMVFHYTAIGDSAALYLGLPALLAIALTLTPKAKSPAGMAVKGTAIGILASAVFLGEGVICILMASPLIFGAALAGVAIARSIRKDAGGQGFKLSPLLILPFVVTSMEGAVPGIDVDRSGSGSASIVVEASATEIEGALASDMVFDTDKLPTYLSLGFPKPLDATTTGIDVGDKRTVSFAGAPKRPTAVEPHHWGHDVSTLVLEVTESSPGHIRYRQVSDNTPVASWVNWTDISVDWKEVGANRTEIVWTLGYERMLAPSWYFGPWQEYAAEKSADYLIHSLPVNE